MLKVGKISKLQMCQRGQGNSAREFELLWASSLSLFFSSVTEEGLQGWKWLVSKCLFSSTMSPPTPAPFIIAHTCSSNLQILHIPHTPLLLLFSTSSQFLDYFPPHPLYKPFTSTAFARRLPSFSFDYIITFSI